MKIFKFFENLFKKIEIQKLEKNLRKKRENCKICQKNVYSKNRETPELMKNWKVSEKKVFLESISKKNWIFFLENKKWL